MGCLPRDPANTRNLGATSFYGAPAGGDKATFRVDAIDNTLPNAEVDFVELDVEGVELPVLQGMAKTIARNRPLLYVEIWHMSLAGNLRWLTWVGDNECRNERLCGPNFLCVPIEKDADALASRAASTGGRGLRLRGRAAAPRQPAGRARARRGLARAPAIASR